MDFMETIKQKARAGKKTIVMPESFEIRNLKAASRLLKDGLVNVALIGAKDAITAKAAELDKNIDVSGAVFIDPLNDPDMGRYIQTLAELRKSKGMTEEEAEKLLKGDPLYLGVMLVKCGAADGMVSGAVHSTADTIRPSLQILKTAPGVKLVSSFFMMIVPDCDMGADGVFLFADSGLVQNPSPEELAAIAQSSAKSFKQLTGVEPVVAMLSHSTKGSARHPDVDKVVEATRLAKAAAPELLIDGELQLDAAIVGSVGQSKAPGSPVAGRANVLIFPDLDAGNIGYKLTQRLAKAEAYGPLTQGIAKPVNDLSRGCSWEDIVGVALITAAQCE